MPELRNAQPQAAISGARALQAQIDHALALHEQGKLEEAARVYSEVLRHQPLNFAALHMLGVIAAQSKRTELAVGLITKAIELNAEDAAAHSNLGIALLHLKRPAEALASYDKAIALQPDFPEAHSNRGVALANLKRHEDALASYATAIALKPDYAEAHQNQSHCLLLMGRFAQGWRQYEWRKKADEPLSSVRAYPQPLWLGEADIAGKTLFVYWEQGLGDTIQFCRYGAALEARGTKVILSVQQPLVELLQQISPTGRVIGPNEAPTDFDYHCPLLSLPLAMGTTLETIPTQHRNIRPDKEKASAWAARLPPKTKPRIGVVWRGRAGHKNDHQRSMNLEQLSPIFSLDADWICLQQEISARDSAEFQKIGRIAFFGRDLTDFSETAALLDLMDLVITVDTSVAHLAGAMGKPVWIMLPFNPDWRWLLNRNDSPWYPAARLFRQQQTGSWAGVINQLIAELPSSVG